MRVPPGELERLAFWIDDPIWVGGGVAPAIVRALIDDLRDARAEQDRLRHATSASEQRAAEREECAKLVENLRTMDLAGPDTVKIIGQQFAAAIRARGVGP